MKNNKQTALITGSAGFIGSHLTRWLFKGGRCKVIAVDDLSGGFRDNLPPDVHFLKGSITDHNFVSELFEAYHIDYVYHLAAYAAEGLSHFIRRYNYTNNLIGSVNLINEAVKHNTKCFIFTSSIAVYGTGQVPMHEDMTPQPEDPYGIAKYAVEKDLETAYEMFGLNYVIFRPHNVYGEYQNIGDRYRNVVGIFMNQILQNRPMTIFGDGEQKRAFSYVGDIIEPIAQAPWFENAYNRVFNIGADTPYTVNYLAEKVCEAMGNRNHPIVHLPERNEVNIAYSDHTNVKTVFGYNSQTPLNKGLSKMAEWVFKVGARESSRFENIEISKNIPQSWAEDTK